MLDETSLRDLPNPVQKHFRRLEHFIVRTIADHLSSIGHSDLHRMQELQRMGFNLNHIEQEIANTLNITQQEVHAALLTASRAEYSGVRQFQHLYAQSPVPFGKNISLQALIQSISATTNGTFSNISNTQAIFLINQNGIASPLAFMYQEAIDFAIMQASLGQETFQNVVLQQTRALADGGIRRIGFNSGHTFRIDSAVRQNVLWGLGDLNRRQTDLIIEQTGADGVEITWHDGYRPTHDWGGLQFTLKDYANNIRPQMEEPNCYHRAFAIVLGISTPSYDDDDLEALRLKNEKEIEFDGETFTLYTAEQRQRKYESAIRQAQDRVNGYHAANLDNERLQQEILLNRLIQDYNRFSEGVGLKIHLNRLEV